MGSLDIKLSGQDFLGEEFVLELYGIFNEDLPETSDLVICNVLTSRLAEFIHVTFLNLIYQFHSL